MEASRDIMNDVNTTTRKAAHDLKGSMQEARSSLKEAFNDRYESVRRQAGEALSTSEEFVKEHPISTVLGACAVGFIAGALLRRRH
ncbi:DUF883 family protein [Bdellovibrio sp. HCB2-146]|uniref:DUF883 family protein n=1 Tax=Bdellovibrio sp. HCB2-146 TaxID=3394362 RepID=UPI0039BCBD62